MTALTPSAPSGPTSTSKALTASSHRCSGRFETKRRGASGRAEYPAHRRRPPRIRMGRQSSQAMPQSSSSCCKHAANTVSAGRSVPSPQWQAQNARGRAQTEAADAHAKPDARVLHASPGRPALPATGLSVLPAYHARSPAHRLGSQRRFSRSEPRRLQKTKRRISQGFKGGSRAVEERRSR